MGAAAGLLGLLALVFLKFKVYIFAAFKALPLLKLGWILKGGASMFLSLGIYMAMFGWRYAITLVGLIYIHEMGHFIWMKVKGLNPKAPVFVPFLGAYVAMTNLPKDAATHAWVAYAGPLVGGLAAGLLYWWGLTSGAAARQGETGHLYLVAAANTGFILNLLQLVPVRPFDGGFIAGAISKWLSIPGIVMLIALALSFHSVLLLIVSGVSLFVVIGQWRSGEHGIEGVVPASGLQKVVISLAYFGLAAGLGFLYWASDVDLAHLRRG